VLARLPDRKDFKYDFTILYQILARKIDAFVDFRMLIKNN